MAEIDSKSNYIRVLLVDDDRDDYMLTRDYLLEIPDKKYSLDWCPDFETGLEQVCLAQHDVYLFDFSLGAKSGLDLLKEVRGRKCIGPVILLTGHGPNQLDQEALEAGAADFLEKSRLDSTLLERSIRYALQQNRYELELEQKVRDRTAELDLANQSLREADSRKNEFIAMLAHELRNPLAPIRHAIEVLRHDPLDARVKSKITDVLDRQVRQMVRLVDDLLDVSRITQGKLELVFQMLDIASPIRIAVESSQPLFEKKSIQLEVEAESGFAWVNGDLTRLSQLFSNLLNNAAKYTPEGGSVRLSVGRTETEVVVRIRDSGIGIPPNRLGDVFQLFTQVHDGGGRMQDGLGIGLALVRGVAELHGGQVEAWSSGADKGSEFLVRLPTQFAPEKNAK